MQLDATAPLQAPDILPAPRPWVFRELRGRPAAAIPEGCRLRAAVMRADVGAQTGFVAEPESLATLVVADRAPQGDRLSGVRAMQFDASGAVINQYAVPWFVPASVPRLGRTNDGGWIGTFTEASTDGTVHIALWREGTLDIVGQGDRADAADLYCKNGHCALLTTRIGRVAMPGAQVWFGPANLPTKDWQRSIIESSEDDSDAHPFAVVQWDPAPSKLEALNHPAPPANDASTLDAASQAPSPSSASIPDGAIGHDAEVSDAAPAPGANTGLVVALTEKGQCIFYNIDGVQAHEMERISAPYGVIDVLGIPEATAMLHGTPVDEQGCVGPGVTNPAAKITFAQGQNRVDLQTSAPPIKGVLRRLNHGALASWLAPLGCKTDRKVVYAVRLDSMGKPHGAIIPIADAQAYAVASHGDDVDLWLKHDDAVTWLRLTCSD